MITNRVASVAEVTVVIGRGEEPSYYITGQIKSSKTSSAIIIVKRDISRLTILN